MNKESIKTIVLTVLIAISLFLTWNMWSLQPTYEEFQNQTVYETVPITEQKRELFEVVKPHQLFFHSNNQHYSTLDEEYLTNLWSNMQEWEYKSESSQPQTFTGKGLQNWIHDQGAEMLEIQFYEEIPMATFQSILKWDNEPNEYLTFDRIFINVINNHELQQKVYFVSYDKMKVVESTINSSRASHFIAELVGEKYNWESYFSFDPGNGKEILLPENKVTLQSYQYMMDEIDSEKFKDAIFSNPRIVKKEANPNKDRYTDGTRELNIQPNKHTVRFVNPPMLSSAAFIEESLLIKQSISFLNDHGGWTDDFVLFDIEDGQKINFIMTFQSIPVINPTHGSTMITQRWGKNEIAIYERPSYQQRTSISYDPFKLMSGRKVHEIITNDQQVNILQIKSIFIAYELKRTEGQIVTLTPAWFIKMTDGSLLKITDVQSSQGGNEDGVE